MQNILNAVGKRCAREMIAAAIVVTFSLSAAAHGGGVILPRHAATDTPSGKRQKVYGSWAIDPYFGKAENKAGTT